MTGPRSNGGKQSPARMPAAKATPSLAQRNSALRQLRRSRRRTAVPCRRDVAAGGRGSTTGRGTRRRDAGRCACSAIPSFIDIDLVVLELFFVVLERGAGRALLQQDVERLLDVVGVQLLVEVDDVVFLVLGGLGGGRPQPRCRRSRRRRELRGARRCRRRPRRRAGRRPRCPGRRRHRARRGRGLRRRGLPRRVLSPVVSSSKSSSLMISFGGSRGADTTPATCCRRAPNGASGGAIPRDLRSRRSEGWRAARVG